jgi:pimeloyl-ACP methyl ester carboxylesterase
MVHRRIPTNGIELHVAEAGDGPLVVCCHGFPELWYSWRHQIPALADAGYRVVAPDQRGYGESDRPEALEAYDVVQLGDDILGLLDAYGEERVVVVGHDWGAIVAWHLGQRAPERLRGLAALAIPFQPRAPEPPTRIWARYFADRFFYIEYFQAEGPADEELAADPETMLRRMLWTTSGDAPPEAFRTNPKGSGYLDALSEPPALPPWLTEEDLAVYSEQFRRTGFTGALRWYRNIDRNWELGAAPWGSARIEVPTLFVAGDRDLALRLFRPDHLDEWVPGLREKIHLPGARPWVQQERPAETNAALLRFLAGLPD